MARKKKEEIIEEVKVEENVSEIKQDANVPEFYTLRIGETLKDVATKFGLNETQLKELNGEVIGTNQVRLK
jgi:hypothetical protein